MNKEQIEQYALTALDDHDLLEKGWTFGINNHKRSIGYCVYDKKRIYISKTLLEQGTEEEIKMVILHEIAHALTEGHNHDKVWKHVCLQIGGDGKRCSDRKFSKKGKWTYSCPSCGLKIETFRKLKRRTSCGECCSTGFNEKYIMEEKRNW